MSAFDKVIGYESIKQELLKICDMVNHRDVYDKMGAKIPQGILLYGDPGLGKTLMGKCFIEETGLKAFTVRRSKSRHFVETISKTFKEAKENAPSIVFLDDMDKFANEDEHHRDAEEYVAVQAGIEEVRDSDVVVFATVNSIWKLPNSLVRAGRFDIKMQVNKPNAEDIQKMVKHLMSRRNVSDRVCVDDFCKMLSYCSCAEIEKMINQAALYAAFDRVESIEMKHLCAAVLKMTYDAPDDVTIKSKNEIEKNAIHEAGHLVVAEVLCPNSIGFASLRSNGRNSTGGFIHMWKKVEDDEIDTMILLAGRAAGEMYYGKAGIEGSGRDISRAVDNIKGNLYSVGRYGLGLADPRMRIEDEYSDYYSSRAETVAQSELERYTLEVKEILLKNRMFLEKIQEALIEKETLLYSDIQKIKTELPDGFPDKAA